MKIRKTLFKLVKRKPGKTACEYTKLMRHPSYYGKTSVLRELHRMCNAGFLVKQKQPGVRPTILAWRWYLIKNERSRKNLKTERLVEEFVHGVSNDSDNW